MRSALRVAAALALAASWSSTWTLAQSGGERPYVQSLEFPTRAEHFEAPVGVAADLHAGEVFVCDSRGQQIVIYDRLGVFRYRISTGSAYRSPIDIAVDPDGFLFVLALRHPEPVIVLLDFDGLFIEEIPVPSVPDSDDPAQPVSLAISRSGDRLYIADQGNLRLWVVARDGTVLGSADLAGDTTEDDGQRQTLGHVDVYDETVLVALPFAGRVELFDLDGNSKGHVGLQGTKFCQSGMPVAAAMDQDGKVLVVDRQRVLVTRWDPDNNRCLGEYLGYGLLPGFLYSPFDAALDGRGRLYVSQGYEGRVQVFEGFTPARSHGVPGRDPDLPRSGTNP